MKDEIDGAAGICGGDDPLAIAGRLKVDDRGAGGKDTPIHRIGERLLSAGKLKPARGGIEDGGILAVRGWPQYKPNSRVTACARVFNVRHGSFFD